MIYYMLDEDHNITSTEDNVEWTTFLEKNIQAVAKSRFGKIEISTVFLGIDHSWGSGPPLLFETMIFGGAHDEYQERCSTWREAELQHLLACCLVLRMGYSVTAHL